MSRLIDADLLKQNCKITGEFDNHFSCVDLVTLGSVIDKQPTVEEGEIIHKTVENVLQILYDILDDTFSHTHLYRLFVDGEQHALQKAIERIEGLSKSND